MVINHKYAVNTFNEDLTLSELRHSLLNALSRGYIKTSTATLLMCLKKTLTTPTEDKVKAMLAFYSALPKESIHTLGLYLEAVLPQVYNSHVFKTAQDKIIYSEGIPNENINYSRAIEANAKGKHDSNEPLLNGFIDTDTYVVICPESYYMHYKGLVVAVPTYRGLDIQDAYLGKAFNSRIGLEVSQEVRFYVENSKTLECKYLKGYDQLLTLVSLKVVSTRSTIALRMVASKYSYTLRMTVYQALAIFEYYAKLGAKRLNFAFNDSNIVFYRPDNKSGSGIRISLGLSKGKEPCAELDFKVTN